SRSLDEPRTVPDRVAYLRRVHASCKLIENRLRGLVAQAVQLPRKCTLLRFRHVSWIAKFTTTCTTTARRIDVLRSVVRLQWLWCWIDGSFSGGYPVTGVTGVVTRMT